MKPLRVRYKRIHQTVNRLLAENGVFEAPVPVDLFARSLGAQIMYTNFNREVSGVLVRHESKTMIAVASEQPPARQRFTIAHELGHLLLHEGNEVHVDEDELSKIGKMNIQEFNAYQREKQSKTSD